MLAICTQNDLLLMSGQGVLFEPQLATILEYL
jgi:hypothetical protein